MRFFNIFPYFFFYIAHNIYVVVTLCIFINFLNIIEKIGGSYE